MESDMGSLYAKHMAHFGCGVGMYHPVSAADMKPPCVGYLDSCRRWNHLTNLEWEGDHLPDTRIYKPLEKTPQKMANVNIEWRPRTSLGVRQHMVQATGASPDGLPGGAEASIRYASKTRFGAVLIAQKPVTLTSYNDETLFRHWINNNRATLAQLHGVELSRYGLLLVTRTYTAPRVSINAWVDKDKDASMSVKAKADMMGELGAAVEWQEKSADKDWAHYKANEGVVAFFDGIQIPAWQWWSNGIVARIRRDLGLAKQHLIPDRSGLGPQGSWRPPKRPTDLRKSSAPGADDAYYGISPMTPSADTPYGRKVLASAAYNEKKPPPEDNPDAGLEEEPSIEDIWGSSTPLRGVSPLSARSSSRGRPKSLVLPTSSRNTSAPTRLTFQLHNERSPQSDVTDPKLRLSTASTAAAHPGTAIIDHAVNGAARHSSDGPRCRELRRKVSTPSLRQSSPTTGFA